MTSQEYYRIEVRPCTRCGTAGGMFVGQSLCKTCKSAFVADKQRRLYNDCASGRTSFREFQDRGGDIRFGDPRYP